MTVHRDTLPTIGVASGGDRLNVPMEDRPKSGRSKADRLQQHGKISLWPRLQQRVVRRRRENPSNLFLASAQSLFLLLIVAAGLWLLLGPVLGDAWPWELGTGETNRYTVARMVLFIGAALVGVVGVVVTYRRQQLLEEGHFLELLGKSASQLGDANPTVQAAGIYTLAGLADRSPRDRKQQCVSVLCTYLRLPYTPSHPGGATEVTTSIVRKFKSENTAGLVEEEHTLALRPHDRQTRETIVRVITQHLKEDAASRWSNLNFDFSGAVFDYGDFKKSIFTGAMVDFTNATFTGEANFSGATFAGKANFENATFTGRADFWNTKFADTVDFTRATFNGGFSFTHSSALAYFSGARFARFANFQAARFRSNTSFRGAMFACEEIIFESVKFKGSVNFKDAELSGRFINFIGADLLADDPTSPNQFRRSKFSGDYINFKQFRVNHYTDFTDAQFTADTIDFGQTYFIGGDLEFRGVKFNGSTIDFQHAQFGDITVDFERAEFNGKIVDFGHAHFAGADVSFNAAQFVVDTVNFRNAYFTDGFVDLRDAKITHGIIDFTDPQDWATPPHVPWNNGDETPDGVLPRWWPPALAINDAVDTGHD